MSWKVALVMVTLVGAAQAAGTSAMQVAAGEQTAGSGQAQSERPAGSGQAQNASSAPPGNANSEARVPVAPPAPVDYVIGTDDVLAIVFWRDPDMSGEVVVRPDGKISLPLVHDIQAAGLTPEQLRSAVEERVRQYVEEPNATVIVRQINSRKVFITGQVARPGPYPLTTPMTVLQLIATAGGLTEYADKKAIFVLRNEAGRAMTFAFNHDDVIRRRNLAQNILLKPGDTVVVP